MRVQGLILQQHQLLKVTNPVSHQSRTNIKILILGRKITTHQIRCSESQLLRVLETSLTLKNIRNVHIYISVVKQYIT